jgi:hypothetical protein
MFYMLRAETSGLLSQGKCNPKELGFQRLVTLGANHQANLTAHTTIAIRGFICNRQMHSWVFKVQKKTEKHIR